MRKTDLFLRIPTGYAEAEPLFHWATEVFRTALGEDHPDFNVSLQNYAALLRKTNRESEASELETKAQD